MLPANTFVVNETDETSGTKRNVTWIGDGLCVHSGAIGIAAIKAGGDSGQDMAS